MAITSPDNAKLKRVRSLLARSGRARDDEFVAEGEDLLAAADAAGWCARERLSAAGSGLPGTEVAPALLRRISGLASGTRTLAVYEQRWAVPCGPLCVALWGVHDPGNVGAILRSALAFGASSVVCGPETADPYSPKAVRASMGAIFSIPVARAETLADLPGAKLALMPGAELTLTEVPARDQLTVIVGGERTGLTPTIADGCDYVAGIPTKIDSLNAAMAATVALYQLTLTRATSPAVAP